MHICLMEFQCLSNKGYSSFTEMTRKFEVLSLPCPVGRQRDTYVWSLYQKTWRAPLNTSFQYDFLMIGAYVFKDPRLERLLLLKKISSIMSADSCMEYCTLYSLLSIKQTMTCLAPEFTQNKVMNYGWPSFCPKIN